MAVTRKEKKEMESWAKQEYHRLRGQGKSHRDAKAALNTAGIKKYGAPDWNAIFEFIVKIMDLFAKFFP